MRSLIAMAHNLGLEVIAEGVETEAQAAFLLDEHCEEAQGYLYSPSRCRPADFEAYLKAKRLVSQADKSGKRAPRSRNMHRRATRALGRRQFPRS